MLPDAATLPAGSAVATTEHFLIGMVRLDEHNRILEANPAFCTMLGYTPDALQALGWTDITYPEDIFVELDLQHYARQGSLPGYAIEKRFVRASGELMDAYVSVQHIPGQQDCQFIVLIDDITYRKRAEHILLRNSERAAALLQLNRLEENYQEHTFIQEGINLVQSLTRSQIAFVHFLNEDQQSLSLGTWSDDTRRFCSAVHNSHYPVNQAGVWVDCLRDLQPHIVNDYRSLSHKRGLPEGHVELIRLISAPILEGGKVRMILGVGNKLTDYDEDDVHTVTLLGNDIWKVVRRQRAEAALAANLEYQRKLNKRLEEAQLQLLQHEKLASLGQLSAGIAHEINNPISFVNSNIGTLARYIDQLFLLISAYEKAESTGDLTGNSYEQITKLKKQLDFSFIREDLPDLIRDSQHGLERVRKIVQDLKDFSRSGSSKDWQWADVHQGLDSTLNIVWNEIKYHADVVKEYGPLPQVYCLPSQLNQVFMNLLVNAAHAIAESGHPQRGRITLRTTQPDPAHIRIQVRDDGCGIPAEHLNRLFDPFFTTKPVGKGTGLGLSLAYSIIEQHHGQITVDSTPGEGAEFTVTLPIQPPVSVGDAPPESAL